jgi:hypothetical protein
MESGSVIKGLAFGAIGSSAAECLVMPLDVLRVRLQMAGADGTKIYSGMFDAAQKTYSKEGIGAFYKGVEPALARQCVYGSLRYGLYAPIRNAIGVDANTPKSEIPFIKKFIAGAGAGAIASAIANPTDLVKVRLQVDGMKTSQGVKPQYTGVADCFNQIIKNEGVAGFWKGAIPNVTRATVLAAFELSCFDEIKQQLIKNKFVEPGTYTGTFLSSLCVGFIATIVSNPIDVIKSRVMGQPVDAKGVGTMYTGMLDCFSKTIKNEGALSLYKGSFPCWTRLGPRGVIIFCTMEFLNQNFPS